MKNRFIVKHGKTDFLNSYGVKYEKDLLITCADYCVVVLLRDVCCVQR